MSKIYGILLTLIAGLFFLVGGIITYKVKNKDKLNYFSVGLAFIVMLGLIFLDILPEVWELLEKYKLAEKIIFLGIFIILGLLILKILDTFIPTHHHNHKDNEKEHEEHISHIHHIGMLTIISLILHNILEGFMICGLAISNFKIGLLIALSIALHNIPLGTHIFSAIDLKKDKVLIGALSLSSLFGGLIFLLGGHINNLVFALVMAFTIGMLIYIIFWELLPEVIVNKNKKETFIGILVGLGLLIVSLGL